VSAAPSLYRRHRPRSFADVVGQEHVVRTLRNAVEQDSVHHAYLFVGSRGTGKTSMAKILAACLNCQNGPTTAPDGTCDSCQAIANASSLDVIEMDAASNNSVDDIRDLRERVAFAPVSGKHKVYILDEAHMLTAQAWNAFLKTLEEPPPNTVFVLATTEANKILPTVADRCHRFDFTRPTVEQIATVLQRVAGTEQIDIPPDALALLARHATGSFRDALGTLEQLVTYAGRSIALDDVLAVLGVADADLLFEALDSIAAHDPRRALLAAARLAQSGRDASAFLRDLEAHARDLLVVGTLGEVPSEIAMTPDRDARLSEQATRVPRRDVVRLLELIAFALEGIKNGADARTQLELALVKAAQPQVDASTQALLSRLERLEAGGAPGPAAAAPPPPPPPSAPAPSEPDPPNGRGLRAVPDAQEPAGASAAAATATATAEVEHSPAEVRQAVDELHGTPTLDGLRAAWPAVVESVNARHSLLGAAVAKTRPCELRGEELTLALGTDDSFLRRKVESTDCRELIAEALRTLTGHKLRLVVDLRDDEPEAEAAPVVSEDEIVERFKKEFEAEEIVPDDEEQR
jgi:DNA polymerase III subunit gamma/tau